jgi:hypothetical protein
LEKEKSYWQDKALNAEKEREIEVLEIRRIHAEDF